MQAPKFLIADNTQFPDEVFIVHTEYPRFLLNVDTEEIEWWDDMEGDKDNMDSEVTQLIEDAFDFLESEMNAYDEEFGEE